MKNYNIKNLLKITIIEEDKFIRKDKAIAAIKRISEYHGYRHCKLFKEALLLEIENL